MSIDKFREKLKVDYGLDLSVYKEPQIMRRLGSYMQRHGIENYLELAAYIHNPDNANKLIDYLDINVSEFFRNPELFQHLERHIWPELVTDSRTIRVWSAGCSNGSEPYSLGIVALDVNRPVKVDIVGTDMDSAALEQARKGRYTLTDIKNVTPERRNKYFDVFPTEVFVKSAAKANVSFRHHDLLHDPVDGRYSLIVCRNVAIYFTEEAKDLMMARFSAALLPGGILFTGATESYPRHREYGLQRLHTCFYQKMGG